MKTTKFRQQNMPWRPAQQPLDTKNRDTAALLYQRTPRPVPDANVWCGTPPWSRRKSPNSWCETIPAECVSTAYENFYWNGQVRNLIAAAPTLIPPWLFSRPRVGLPTLSVRKADHAYLKLKSFSVRVPSRCSLSQSFHKQ